MLLVCVYQIVPFITKMLLQLFHSSTIIAFWIFLSVLFVVIILTLCTETMALISLVAEMASI